MSSKYHLHNCLYCGTSFRTYLCRTTKFCSQRCRGLYSRKDYHYVCGFCEQAFTGSRSRKPSKSELKFCSRQCYTSWRLKGLPRNANSKALHHLLARRGKIDKCERCDFEVASILEVHHKDIDKRNNALANLEILCPNCHSLAHLSQKGVQ